MRLVVDFRKLNLSIENHSFQLPVISEILKQLGNAKYISQLDLASAFHQIELDDNSKKLTAFSVGSRKYQYNRLPFG